MITRCEVSNELLLFNYPLFGGWLPFIGFRNMIVDLDEDEFDVVRTFSLEWFLYGVDIMRLPEDEEQL